MKSAFFGLALAAVAASVNAVDYEVMSCAELAGIDDTTVTSLTITSTDFECDSYTRFRVRNDMALKSDSAVVFTNFALKVLGDLTVEPDVTFQNVTEQDTNGGALYVDKDASATFLGTSRFLSNTVTNALANEDRSRNGGAVFNKGNLVFEGDATFLLNKALTEDSTDVGRGGAIYNARIGTITFNAGLTADENRGEGFFEGQGGAIFTSGEIVVNGESSFADNRSSDGPAVYVHEAGSMTFNAFATFTENVAYDFRGGAIANFGSLNLMGGSLFLSNFADGSGDGGFGGGICNDGTGSLSFGGVNTFDDNWGFLGGAIYNGEDATIAFPEDGGEVIFQNLRGEICPGIYYRGEDNQHTCGP